MKQRMHMVIHIPSSPDGLFERKHTKFQGATLCFVYLGRVAKFRETPKLQLGSMTLETFSFLFCNALS